MRRGAILMSAMFVAACTGGGAGSLGTGPGGPRASSAETSPTVSEAAARSSDPSPSASASATSGQVAYATSGEDAQVFLLDLASGESRQLTALDPSDADLVGTGPLSPAISCGFGISWLEWSPDGSQLTFTYGACEAVIFLVDLDGGLTRLAEGTGPAWSPDGSRIAFRPNVPYCPAADPMVCGEPPAPGAWNLHVVEPTAGSVPRPLTADDALIHAGQPRWSPDGTALAFTAPLPDATSHPNLFAATWVSRSDGSDARLIARGAWPAGWLADGRLVIVEEQTGELNAIDLTTADAILLGASHGPSAVAPDGSRMLLSSSNPTTGSLEARLATSDGDVVTELGGWGAAWSPDSRAAVVIDTETVGGLVIVGRDGQDLGAYPIPNAPFGVGVVAWRPGT